MEEKRRPRRIPAYQRCDNQQDRQRSGQSKSRSQDFEAAIRRLCQPARSWDDLARRYGIWRAAA